MFCRRCPLSNALRIISGPDERFGFWLGSGYVDKRSVTRSGGVAYRSARVYENREGNSVNILTVNLVFSTLVFWMAARIYLLSRLSELSPRAVLLPILLLHAMRHLGLMFLAPGAIYAGLPTEFAYPAAYGDLLTALLAVAAIPAVATNARGNRLMVWIFNLVGTADLIVAITLATWYGAAPYMGAAYWIPAFWVPALLVTHYITFVILWRERRGSRPISNRNS
jgi:hypothetical protein